MCKGTSRNTMKRQVASGVFQQAGFAKLLRLVFNTAALRGSAWMRPFHSRQSQTCCQPLRSLVETVRFSAGLPCRPAPSGLRLDWPKPMW